MGGVYEVSDVFSMCNKSKVQSSGLKTRDEAPAEANHKMCKHSDAALDCSELNKHI